MRLKASSCSYYFSLCTISINYSSKRGFDINYLGEISLDLKPLVNNLHIIYLDYFEDMGNNLIKTGRDP